MNLPRENVLNARRRRVKSWFSGKPTFKGKSEQHTNGEEMAKKRKQTKGVNVMSEKTKDRNLSLKKIKWSKGFKYQWKQTNEEEKFEDIGKKTNNIDGGLQMRGHPECGYQSTAYVDRWYHFHKQEERKQG